MEVNKYVLVSLRYTGDILGELIKRAENFKLEEDRVEYMVNQAYRYLNVYDVTVDTISVDVYNKSVTEGIKDRLIDIYGDSGLNINEIELSDIQKLKNNVYWTKIEIHCIKDKGLQGVINSGNRLILIKSI